MHLLKIMLFTSVVNLAVLVVNLRGKIMELPVALPVRVVLFSLGLLVPVLTLSMMPTIIGFYNLVTSIEAMKNEHAVTEVIKEQKYRRHQRATQVLASLQFFIDQAEMLAATNSPGSDGEGQVRDTEAQYEKMKRDPSMSKYIAELENLFFSFDADKSGNIDIDELGQLLSCMGQQKSEEELERLFNLMDADNSGNISVDEFCTVMAANRSARRNQDPRAIAEKMYGHFDDDNNGTIEPEEMIAAFQRMGQNWDMEAVREFLLAIDADGSGTIEKEEFISFVSNFVGENQ
jgi:Ca2+-binding EF-hand superfamily protein